MTLVVPMSSLPLLHFWVQTPETSGLGSHFAASQQEKCSLVTWKAAPKASPLEPQLQAHGLGGEALDEGVQCFHTSSQLGAVPAGRELGSVTSGAREEGLQGMTDSIDLS